MKRSGPIKRTTRLKSGGYDQGNTVPLCRRHHRIQHNMGIESFQMRYIINLEKWAVQLGAFE